MEFFLDAIQALHALAAECQPQYVWEMDQTPAWASGGPATIVLKEDLGLELGSPDQESVSSLLWTQTPGLVRDGRITLLGPDFPASRGKSLPFGKAVLAQVQGFDAHNAHARHRDLDALRYDLNLKGFMLRAASQYMREWCRISTAALSAGFNARILGSALLSSLRAQPYVVAAEVIYFTSSREDVLRLREIAAPAEKIIAAMNKMASELDCDCASCEYQPVCDEASELKAMREKLKNGKQQSTEVLYA